MDRETKDAKGGLDDAYLSVNEGLTTDTAMSTDMEAEGERTMAAQEASGEDKTTSGIVSDSEEEGPQSVAGIASSDEEEMGSSQESNQ